VALRASHPDIEGLLCVDATLQADRDQGGLELLTRLRWHGQQGSDETLVQMRDQISGLIANGPGLSLRVA
jgi:hypothetical protein